MIAKLLDGSTVDCHDEPFHAGAEGQVFASKDNLSIVKLYHKVDSNRQESLEAIIGQYNVVRGNEYWRQLFCWPDGIVISPQLGVKMPRAPGQLKDLNWFLLPKSRARLTSDERGDWRSHLGISIRLSRAIRLLHNTGLCHSDLSRNNCLVSPKEMKVVLIDLDGLVVPGFLPARVSGTPEFMAPEIVASDERPSINTDLHSLAVLLYQTLLFRHPLKGPKCHSAHPEEDDKLAFGSGALFIEHPTDTSNTPKKTFIRSSVLGRGVENLFMQVFIDGLKDPSRRPKASEWEAQLVRLADKVVRCSNPKCDLAAFPFLEHQQITCPWCGTKWKDPVKLLAIDLYRPIAGRKGQYIPDNWQIVAQEDRCLYEWHVYADRPPNPESNRNPIAQFLYESTQQTWYLMNISTDVFFS